MNKQSETHSPQLEVSRSSLSAAGCFNWFCEIRWGAKSIVSLYISVISGIIVAFQYDLMAPFYSTGSLDVLIPFGRFWRSLHYHSSQFFFILLLIHLAVVLIDKRLAGNSVYNITASFSDKESLASANKSVLKNSGTWLLLTLSLPVATLILFTGYILRFDSTGESAGYIAENIIRSVPFLGPWLNAFLFNLSSASLKVVYTNHVIGLVCLWLYMSWSHLRKYRVLLLDHGSLLILLLCMSFFLNAPVEPVWPGNFHVLGPWFFIGLQELLRFLPPFTAGVLVPAAGLVFLCLAVLDQGRWRWPMIWTCIWCLAYVYLTIIGWSR